jgi:hypothetical protein
VDFKFGAKVSKWGDFTHLKLWFFYPLKQAAKAQSPRENSLNEQL